MPFDRVSVYGQLLFAMSTFLRNSLKKAHHVCEPDLSLIKYGPRREKTCPPGF